jgi:hypothetical protein
MVRRKAGSEALKDGRESTPRLGYSWLDRVIEAGHGRRIHMEWLIDGRRSLLSNAP